MIGIFSFIWTFSNWTIHSIFVSLLFKDYKIKILKRSRFFRGSSSWSRGNVKVQFKMSQWFYLSIYIRTCTQECSYNVWYCIGLVYQQHEGRWHSNEALYYRRKISDKRKSKSAHKRLSIIHSEKMKIIIRWNIKWRWRHEVTAVNYSDSDNSIRHD